MGIDTKPNFSSNKFEQCITDTMNLSGCTQIYGYLDIESGATITICDNANNGSVFMSDADGVATWKAMGCGMTTVNDKIAVGTPSSISNISNNQVTGTTHNHCLMGQCFVTGTQGILVNGSNQFYLDDTYITDQTLPSLYGFSGITGNSSIGALPSGQTLGMVYITNTGGTTGYFSLGTTPSGDDITPYQTIQVDPDEDVSVTINMRLSLTENKTIYVSSTDWTDVGINLQWANITYQNASTTINPGDLPIASKTTVGVIQVGDGLDIDGAGLLSVTGGSGAGTITGATNLGTGNGTIFTSVNGENIQLKTLSGGTDITITCNGNYIAINSSSAGTITGGTNGLGYTGADICLGGTLSNNTSFEGTGSNYHLCYGGDYSDAYSARSIPDVGYVTGLTFGGFLGTVTETSSQPEVTLLANNQWVKPAPTSAGSFNYTFDNFSDSGSTAISVNLSLEDIYLRYCCTGASAGYWIKESYDRPITSGHTWIGDLDNKVCEVQVINEWVGTVGEICYTGQKFTYPTQTISQVDVGTCVTTPNKIFIDNIDLKTVGNTCIFAIPSGKTAIIIDAKLVMKNNSTPDSFTVSIGNNSCGTPSLSYNNMMSDLTVDDVLENEVYNLVSGIGGAAYCDGSCLGSDVNFRVQTAATGATLNANLIFEGYVY